MSERKVLLVGWDGADWKIARPLLESGQLPQLALALKNGASGPVSSLPPYLSPMLWNSMATGKRPHRHGILGFSQVNAANGRVQPVSSHLRRCPAFWNILSERGIPNHVVGWFASHPAEKIRGVCVSEAFIRPPRQAGQDWPIPRNAVSPPEWSDRLGETRVRVEDVDQGLLRLFLPFMDEMDLERDRRWEEILYRLAELYTAHNAAVTLLDTDSSWRCFAVYYHFIDWVCHEFMPYRPPQRPGIPERDVRLYGSVVDAAYRVQDFLLADLLRHAGPDVTLLLTSDHGFQSDHLRPAQTPDVTAGIADWHRPHGMIVISGPGIKSGETVEGASILDVGPTLLHLLGLPVGEDMDGRALFEVVEKLKRPETIPSWESEITDWWRAPGTDGSVCEAPEEEAELLQQFADLGYLEMPSNPHEDLAQMTDRENAFNLGISLLDAGLPEEALRHLWQACAELPEVPHYAFHLARALAALRLEEEVEEVLEVIRDFGENNPQGLRLRGQIALQLGNRRAAARHLEAAADVGRGDVSLQNQRGLLALQEERFGEAEDFFRKALAIDGDDATAWLGLARSFSRREKYHEAAEAARRALSLKRELPIAHLTLAQASEALGDPEAAAASYAEALRLEPNLVSSRDGLLRLHPGASDETQERVLSHLARARHTKMPEPSSPARARRLLRQLREEHQENVAERRATQVPVECYEFPTSVGVGTSGKTFFIVSGLPRAGTSMLMQMLARGGMEPMTDGVRTADTDNPRGYYEWEAVKRLAENPAAIEEAGDRVVKVISAQLRHLPREHSYKVVFIRRPVEEVAQSQRAMLDRLEKAGAGKNIDTVAPALSRHETATLGQLRSRPEIALLELHYHEVLTAPDEAASQLRDFFGADRTPAAVEMARAVDPALHRRRIQP